MSRRAPRPLTGAFAALTARLAPASTLAAVQQVWPAAVGPAIAAVAQPSGEADGLLTVRCESSVWAQELELMSGDVLGRLNALLDGVELRSMRCRAG